MLQLDYVSSKQYESYPSSVLIVDVNNKLRFLDAAKVRASDIQFVPTTETTNIQNTTI